MTEKEETRTLLTDEEIWNLETSLAGLIADAIKRLKEMGHGHPIGITEECWDKILDTIANDFQRYADEEENPPYLGLSLMTAWWRDLWD